MRNNIKEKPKVNYVDLAKGILNSRDKVADEEEQDGIDFVYKK